MTIEVLAASTPSVEGLQNSTSTQTQTINQPTHHNKKHDSHVEKPYHNIEPSRNKRLNIHIKNLQKQNWKAAQAIIDNQILQPSTEGLVQAEGLERTYKFSQKDILSNTESGLLKKVFNLNLSYGPYHVESSRNGSHLLLSGRSGQISLLNTNSFSCLTEFNVKETVRDIKILQDHSMFAAAQKKYLYIYDQQGIEIHCMRDNLMSYCLEYLPYHFILTSIGEFGELRYDDISTGQVVAKHKTSKGPCRVMRQNFQNANIFLGHTKGTVTTWIPNLSKPAIELLCHKGPITSLDVYQNYLATSGLDGFWKIWDLRMNKVLHCFNYYGTPPNTIRISQTGIVALGFGSHVQFWKDSYIEKQKMPYLTQEYPGSVISSLCFRPFEDNCFIGKSDGISSILVPGSGIANYDILEENPFETKKQRKEKQIKRLLEKLQPEMISVTNKIAIIDTSSHSLQETEQVVTDNNSMKLTRKKKKMRGRGDTTSRNRASTILRATNLRKIKSQRIKTIKNTKRAESLEKNFNALNRFKKASEEK